MSIHLPYEITKSVEEVLRDPELAKKVIKAIEDSLSFIEEKAKEQKPLLKAEIKEDLLKELVTKDELKATEERLRGEIKATEERLKVEIHRWRADTIKWMFIFWIGQIVAFIGVLKFMLK